MMALATQLNFFKDFLAPDNRRDLILHFYKQLDATIESLSTNEKMFHNLFKIAIYSNSRVGCDTYVGTWQCHVPMSLPRWRERQNRDIFDPTEKRYILIFIKSKSLM